MVSLIQQISKQLAPLGQSARQQASWLIEYVLGYSPTQLLAQPNPPIKPEQQQQLQEYVNRLLKHEPIQYVLGEAYFYGYKFKVSPAVLIPRPETEELVHHIVLRHKNAKNLSGLDLCTGSGCIAISLAKELPQAKLTATDVSIAALQVAQENNAGLEAEIVLLQHDILKEEITGQYDFLVSNPPYVRPSEKEQMHSNVLDWEPHLALFIPEEDPLLFYRSIAQKALNSLKSNGWLYFEINEAYGRQTAEMLQQLGFSKVQILKDMQGKDRMLEAQLISSL